MRPPSEVVGRFGRYMQVSEAVAMRVSAASSDRIRTIPSATSRSVPESACFSPCSTQKSRMRVPGRTPWRRSETVISKDREGASLGTILQYGGVWDEKGGPWRP